MNSYMDELNDKQREAVEHFGSPLLILAGAGSGKTKALTYKAAYTIDVLKASPENLLLVTFTNKAAREMKERIGRVTRATLPNVGTFHSIAARMLRIDGKEIGVPRDFVIYDAQDQIQLVKSVEEDLGIDQKRFKPGGVLAGISSAKQEMIGPEKYATLARGPFQEVVGAVYYEYQKRLGRSNALDFDDILARAVEIMQASPVILQKYKKHFDYVFVDEYQDTNSVQYTFTKLISVGKNSLTVVGDASQSIYKWRGADYRNIVRLKEDFPDLKEIRLERNYRSTQNILSAGTQVISKNTTHPVLSLWTEEGKGEKVGLIGSYTAEDEARSVVQEIIRNKKIRGNKWSDFAILYRTNAQSRAFEEALIREEVPYVLVGGVKFYERAEIKDILAYLRLVYNSKDEVSRKRIEKLGKRRMAAFDSEFEVGEGREDETKKIIDRVLRATSYMDRYDKNIEEDTARIENIRELAAIASEYTKLGDFLENVALVQSEYYAGEVGKVGDSVNLMTLHAAKGLEFKTVFLVGMEEGLFPHSRSMLEKEELEEERRLCYVGITRAKEKLYLTYASRRSAWGGGGVSN